MDIDQRYQFAQEHGYDPKQPVSKKFMKRIQKANFPKGTELRDSAFWINKNGKFFTLDKSSGDRHIYYIVDNPEIFGYTKERIQKIYQKYDEHDPYDNEKNPMEGKAREEIIIDVLKDGWIRIRNYLKQSRWSINIYQLDKQTKYSLQEWADSIIANGTKDMKNNDVVIDMPNGNIKTNIQNVANGDFSNQNTPNYAQPIKLTF